MGFGAVERQPGDISRRHQPRDVFRIAPALAWGDHHHHGYAPALGIGLAIGTIAAAAAASNAYQPAYECYYQKRYNR